MSALREAVAGAIRSDSRLPWHTVQEANLAAGVAIDVVLAEAKRSIEARLVCYAPGCTASAPFCEGEGCWSVHEGRADALAALAALGEQA